MEEMFLNSYSAEEILIINFKAPNLKSMKKMFSMCYNLKETKLEGLLQNINISNLISMEEMFSNCYI